MSADDERYVKGSLCSPYMGGAYAYLDPNRAGPLHAYAIGYLEAAITFGESESDDHPTSRFTRSCTSFGTAWNSP